MEKQFLILAVDDDPVNLKVVSMSLGKYYAVITATNGVEALKLLDRQQPDLILLDVMMPEITGFEVCRRIKSDSRYADIPVIFLTALDTFEGEMQGLDFGGIDYLTKPINLSLLLLRVRNHLALKEQRDLLARQKAELEAALARVKQLEGIITICMYCKQIREEGVWQQLEAYFLEHTDALFSHGICPECYEEQKNALLKV